MAVERQLAWLMIYFFARDPPRVGRSGGLQSFLSHLATRFRTELHSPGRTGRPEIHVATAQTDHGQPVGLWSRYWGIRMCWLFSSVIPGAHLRTCFYGPHASKLPETTEGQGLCWRKSSTEASGNAGRGADVGRQGLELVSTLGLAGGCATCLSILPPCLASHLWYYLPCCMS